MNFNQIIIFASGSGSNAENIINYFSNKSPNYKWLIYTNNPKARVIERAKKLQIDYKIFTIPPMESPHHRPARVTVRIGPTEA